MNAVQEPSSGREVGASRGLVSRGRSRLDRTLGLIILGVLAISCVVVMRPFFSALLWAVVLCYSSWPVYHWLVRHLGSRRTLSALVMTLGLTLLILVPFVVVGSTLGANVRTFATAAQGWLAQGPPPPPAWLAKAPVVGSRLTARYKAATADTAQLRARAQQWIEPVSAWALRAAVALGGGLLQLALSLLIILFLFRDGEVVGQRLDQMVNRLGGEQGRHLLRVAGSTIRGVVYGILGTSIIQSVLAGIGFFIAGVPGVGLLTLLTFFACFIPIVGTALIWLPTALWLFHQGATGWGVFMLVWGFAVGNLDNIVRPLLISQGSDMPFILILFGVLGGALAFGFIGVFLGPTLLAVGFRLLEEWSAVNQPPPAPAPVTP